MSQFCKVCNDMLDWEPYDQLCWVCEDNRDARRGYFYDPETGEKIKYGYTLAEAIHSGRKACGS